MRSPRFACRSGLVRRKRSAYNCSVLAAELVSIRHQSGRQDVQITAWGSFALEVPNLNFRSFSLVSVEKVYSRDSEDWDS